MSLLQIKSVSKSYGGVSVLHTVSLCVREGEIVCLLGPSGCGKTTLLRIVAGLETADSGQVTFDGQLLDEVAVHRRGFGLMFQDYALFPHKDVAANIAFGLRMRALPRQQVEDRVLEMLDLVGLEGYQQRRVYDLSGGEQQRVALARSLAPGPRLLMLDEPLGSLDRALREELMNELRTILKQVGVTAVYVTHDQQEAFAIADRVFVMHDGTIVQQGVPEDVYQRPNSAWVARFLGLTNLFPCRVAAIEPPQVDTDLGRFLIREVAELDPGQEGTLLIRPEAARVVVIEPEKVENPLTVTVVACSFRGSYRRLVIRHESGAELVFDLVADGTELPKPEDPIVLDLRPSAISLLAAQPAHSRRANSR